MRSSGRVCHGTAACVGDWIPAMIWGRCSRVPERLDSSYSFLELLRWKMDISSVGRLASAAGAAAAAAAGACVGTGC